MNTLWKLLGIIGILIIMAFASGIGKQIGRSTVKKYHSSRSAGAIEEMLRKVSGHVNRTLPVMIDKNTRLETTLAGPGNRFTYLHTILSVDSTTLSHQQLEHALGRNIRNTVCSSKDMQAFVSNKVQVIYRYRDSDGRIIGDLVVNSEDCR